MASKIYTKTGDKGQTGLFGGTRVSKADIKIEAYGTVDELNAYIGLVAEQPINSERVELLRLIQVSLFNVGSQLASDGSSNMELPNVTSTDIEELEAAIDEMNEQLEPMKNFILPGGTESASYCHIARTICRRAERSVIRYYELRESDLTIIAYLNRLSDYLFVLARLMVREAGAAEIPWKPRG